MHPYFASQDTLASCTRLTSIVQHYGQARAQVVYKISYRRACAWPSGCLRPSARAYNRSSKGILHTIQDVRQGNSRSVLKVVVLIIVCYYCVYIYL